MSCQGPWISKESAETMSPSATASRLCTAARAEIRRSGMKKMPCTAPADVRSLEFRIEDLAQPVSDSDRAPRFVEFGHACAQIVRGCQRPVLEAADRIVEGNTDELAVFDPDSTFTDGAAGHVESVKAPGFQGEGAIGPPRDPGGAAGLAQRCTEIDSLGGALYAQLDTITFGIARQAQAVRALCRRAPSPGSAPSRCARP